MTKKLTHEERTAKMRAAIESDRAKNRAALDLVGHKHASKKNKPHEDFWSYFNVADELYGAEHDQPRPDDPFPPLTLEDLDLGLVEEAHRFVTTTDVDMPWPPYLPEAEEFRLSNIEFTDGKEGW